MPDAFTRAALSAAYRTFGVQATLTRAAGGAPAQVRVLDATAGRVITLDAEGIGTLEPAASIRVEDLPTPARGDLLTIRGRAWRVAGWIAETADGDGQGEWILRLEEERA